jgi:methyl coenzyme M reductase subunit C-like uncharacterized protein (methanogenesis marker protein 7)
MNTDQLFLAGQEGQREKMERLIESLPHSPADIAAYLSLQGCFGVLKAMSACPLSEYFRKNGLKNVDVSYGFIRSSYGIGITFMMKTPKHLKAFAQEFDNGKYPELVREHGHLEIL